MRRSLTTFAGLCLLCALPAGAGVLYVPVPPLEAGQSLDLRAVNRDPATGRRFDARLLPLASDGTAGRQGAPLTTLAVAPGAGRSVVLGTAAQAGLLEIVSAPQLSFEARLFESAETRVPTSLPVITSENHLAAGELAELVGLRRTGDGLGSGVGIVNLTHTGATCTAKLRGATGATIGAPATFSLLPLSHAYFADALAAFAAGNVADAHLLVACDRGFFAYAVISDAGSGRRGIVTPAARGDSSLSLPGEGPVVPPGAVAFSQQGVFHTASEAKPTQVFNIPVPAGKPFRQVTVSFDYHHAGWSHTPDGNHSIFWLHRGVWLDSRWADNIYAFVNAFGPSKNLVKMLTNVDAGKARQVWSQAYGLEAGHTYHVEYLYDTDQQVVSLKLTDKATGQQVVDIGGDTYGKPLVADGSGSFFVYFGHQDDTGIAPERPSYGSSWSALEVLFLP